MMKRVMNVVVAVVMVGLAVVAGMSVKQSIDWHSKYNAEKQACEQAQDALVEMQEEEDARVFDTSIIEAWCGDGCDGKVRMVGATVVSTEDGLVTLEDETGELWLVESTTLAESDDVLLWIADNHTTDDKTDDIIIKVYTEMYE